MSNDGEKCFRAGCDDYAAKPIEVVTFIRLIAKYACGGETSPSASGDLDPNWSSLR